MERRLVLLLGLAGCSGSIDAPSLAPRAIEQAGVPTPDVAAEPSGAVDPALAPRLNAIIAAAQEGHRRFDEAQRMAEAAAGRPDAHRAGSDGWTAAQQSLSALETTRDGVRTSGADLDMLRSDPAFASAANREAIDAAAARVAMIDDEEGKAIAAIAAKLD